MSKRQKAVHLLKGLVKNFVMPVGIFLVFAPVRVYADDMNDSCENKAMLSKKTAALMTLKSSIGITKCMDPTATTLEKTHACLKPCCAVFLLASLCLSEQENVAPKVKFIAASCCTISWAALSALEGKKALFDKN